MMLRRLRHAWGVRRRQDISEPDSADFPRVSGRFSHRIRRATASRLCRNDTCCRWMPIHFPPPRTGRRTPAPLHACPAPHGPKHRGRQRRQEQLRGHGPLPLQRLLPPHRRPTPMGTLTDQAPKAQRTAQFSSIGAWLGPGGPGCCESAARDRPLLGCLGHHVAH